jgi:uncharacterized protein (DUF58 family)
MRTQLYLSRYGLVFIPILAAMLLAAINYDNNLVYIVLFLLISLMVVSVVYTYRNLARLEIRPGHMWPVYAGGTLRYTLVVINHAAYPVYGITFRRPDAPPDFRVICESVPPEGTQTVEFIEQVHTRGRFHIREMQVASIFPLGLFRSVHNVRLNWEYVVYPQLKGPRQWPSSEPDPRTQDDGHFRGGENFYGLRNYQQGESQRHVDWKAVARGRPMMVKEFGSGGMGRLWFDWRQLGDMDSESKLSQLAYWAVQADQMGVPFGLRLPHQEFPPLSGALHLQKCLTALATYSRRWP